MEKKKIVVEYVRDPENWALTATPVSEHFNLSAVVINASDFGKMKERAPEAIDNALIAGGYSERVWNTDISYQPKA